MATRRRTVRRNPSYARRAWNSAKYDWRSKLRRRAVPIKRARAGVGAWRRKARMTRWEARTAWTRVRAAWRKPDGAAPRRRAARARATWPYCPDCGDLHPGRPCPGC